MSAAIASIRRVVAEYSAEYGVSVRQMAGEALLGTLAMLVLFIDTVLLLVELGR